MYVRMKDVEKNGHDVFEFTGGHAYGHSDLVMFLDTENRWRVASRSVHMEGPSNLCYLMCKGCIHGAPLEGVWSVYDGKAWVPNLSIKTENITDPERVAGALKRKTQMQRRYSHARKATKGIRFEHIQGTAGQSCTSMRVSSYTHLHSFIFHLYMNNKFKLHTYRLERRLRHC